MALQAACKVLERHGITPDRADILQNANTLVVRMTESVVARVVQRIDGPRHGTEWFERENAIAAHLTSAGAPVIPLHPGLPPGPHLLAGFPMNFWEYVEVTDALPNLEDAGARLAQCHGALRTFEGAMPVLEILKESLRVADRVESEGLLEFRTVCMLRAFLNRGLDTLVSADMQVLHGDAHLGNLLQTTRGPLWTDWEDTFIGPVEWDLASAVWNARFLEEDINAEAQFLKGYQAGGGTVCLERMEACYEARAAVICVWYPVLYPEPDTRRRDKLEKRLKWLACRAGGSMES